MTMVTTKLDVTAWGGSRSRALLEREWLVTNGLGGYASSTVVGTLTRRYHGLLVAALPAPWGRVLSLTHIRETIIPAGSDRSYPLSAFEAPECEVDLSCVDFLKSFELNDGLPEWEYQVGFYTMRKSLFMPHGQNTVHVTYEIVEGPDDPLPVQIAPYLHFRPHGADVDEGSPGPYELEDDPGEPEALVCRAPGSAGSIPPLRLALRGQARIYEKAPSIEQVSYASEQSRRYPFVGRVWCPGFYALTLERSRPVTLIASMEEWPTINALPPSESLAAELDRRHELLAAAPEAAADPFGAALVLAADQFIISPPAGRPDSVRALSAGKASLSIVAGYHWFTEWGRDTMISLEGLCLATGRYAVAESALRTFAYHVRDGLIPNLFPEGNIQAVYNTADATLWFVHALHRYTEHTGDREVMRSLLSLLLGIVEHHRAGTSFGIGMDPEDGLLRQGADGYALTWMDAKMGDWVVTPRRGKAVEVNALWYNALSLIARWLEQEGNGQPAATIQDMADTAARSFNDRFWFGEGGYLYDTVDGPGGSDSSCRPNQIFAIALPFPVLRRERWHAVVDTIARTLVTPFGLRTLAPEDPAFQHRYYGDLRARDGAYHQGTVWPWLIGAYAEAWLKLHPEDEPGASDLLSAFEDHMHETCIGSISEVFDAMPPFVPGGCVAQAWSVAEVLRMRLKTRGAKPSAKAREAPLPAGLWSATSER